MKRIFYKLKKVYQVITATLVAVFFMSTTALADLQGTPLVTGTQRLIEDVTNWLMGLGTVITILMVIYCLIRRNMADEMDHKKWQTRAIVSLVSGVGVVVASAVINAVVGYYQ